MDRARLTRNGIAMLSIVIATVGVGAIDAASDLGTDYGAYFSHGWFLTRGLSPYADFWTHKTPFLVVMLAAWIEMFGRSFIAAVAFPLVVSAAAAAVVGLFARALDVPRRAAVIAALLFAFVAASHVIDPTRNGVIVIAAAVFEMLAVVAVLWAEKSDRRGWLLMAGVLVTIATATRQTAAITGLAALGIIVATRRDRHAMAADGIALIAGGLIAAVAFLGWLLGRGVSLGAVWDQVYRFNVVYATGYDTKLTWWLASWANVVIVRGLLMFVVGLVGFAMMQIRPAHARGVPTRTTRILALLAAAHLLAIFLSKKVEPFYLYQLLPELCIATAIATDAAIRTAGALSRTARLSFATAAIVVLCAWPATLEARYWSATARRAAAGGYLFDPSRVPSQVTARAIRSLAPSAAERIWVFSASADALYPFADRLPALPLTSTAFLVYEMSGDDFGMWRRQFDAGRPTVVVSVYGDAFAARYAHRPIDEHGQTTATILRIREYLLTHMRRVAAEGSGPELYVPGATASS
jgi:hypothetical protein